MARWIEHIDIHGVLDKYPNRLDDCDPVPDSLKAELAAECRKSRRLPELAERFEDCEDIGELDSLLDELYDEADDKRVWVGGVPGSKSQP